MRGGFEGQNKTGGSQAANKKNKQLQRQVPELFERDATQQRMGMDGGAEDGRA